MEKRDTLKSLLWAANVLLLVIAGLLVALLLKKPPPSYQPPQPYMSYLEAQNAAKDLLGSSIPAVRIVTKDQYDKWVDDGLKERADARSR